MLSSVASILFPFSVSLSLCVPKMAQDVLGTLFLVTDAAEKRRFTSLVTQKSSGVGLVGPSWPALGTSANLPLNTVTRRQHVE